MTKPILLTDRDYEAALADATESAESALNDARMPIHILLSARFGDLNDNQEEMLTAAASLLERTAEELRALRILVNPGEGVRAGPSGVVRIGDVVRSIQPELSAQAEMNGVRLIVDIEPAVPSAVGIAAQLRDAIRLVISDETQFAMPGTTVSVTVRSTTDDIIVAVRSGAPRAASRRLLLAKRLIQPEGGQLHRDDGGTTISIPRRATTRPSADHSDR